MTKPTDQHCFLPVFITSHLAKNGRERTELAHYEDFDTLRGFQLSVYFSVSVSVRKLFVHFDPSQGKGSLVYLSSQSADEASSIPDQILSHVCVPSL